MNNTSPVLKTIRAILLAGAAGGGLSASALALPATGEAVVVAATGQTQARVFTAPVHEGRTELRDLFEGAAVGENARVITGKDGRLCMACSAGAVLCVAPQTEFTIQQLRHTADGLPRSEEDLTRSLHLVLHKGRVRVQAGTPTATMDIQIETAAGTIEARGGAFVVAQNGNAAWSVYSDAYELTLAARDGQRTELKAGGAARMTIAGEDRVDLQTDGVDVDPDLHQFELCNSFFEDLEPLVDDATEFDREGLARYLGLSSAIVELDSGALVTDASPTIRPSVSGAEAADLSGAGTDSGRRWSEERIWKWYDDLGTVKGVNYVPRTAVNSVEMWMESTFDPDTIDEELGWAHGLGYTAIRVQLQYAVWKEDPDGFLDRADQLLDLASKHGLRVVPVLFDDLDIAGEAPRAGEQKDPIPGEYNSRWVPSPAKEAVTDRRQWPELETYVKDVMGEFKRDGRVLYWDLYNTAGNGGLWEETLPLMDQTFNWARSVDASQPLAVAAWKEYGSAMAARKLERSDLIAFQSFENAESVEARIQLLKRYNRPIICSDWLMRQAGNDFENVLPLFAAHRVGWFNCGFVAGKTQLEIQQAQYRSETDPDLWQQAVLHPDGTPFDRREIERIQGFQYMETP
ncbi:MAG: FecR domain-containing protein [Kiritimatiellia bacterium]